MGHLNICGQRNKEAGVYELIQREELDILGMCETFLNEKDNAPHMPGYSWLGRNGTRKERGVGFYVKNELKKDITDLNILNRDVRMIALTYRDVSLVEAYAQVNYSRKEARESIFTDLMSALAGLTLKTKGILLLGDFNAHVIGFTSEETNINGEILLRTLGGAGLDLLGVNKVTFLGRNGIPTCIDYFETRGPHIETANRVYDEMIGAKKDTLSAVIFCRVGGLREEFA